MFPALLFLLVAGKCKCPQSDKDKISLAVKTRRQIPSYHQSHKKSLKQKSHWKIMETLVSSFLILLDILLKAK